MLFASEGKQCLWTSGLAHTRESDRCTCCTKWMEQSSGCDPWGKCHLAEKENLT